MKILNVGCGKQTYGTHFVDAYPLRKEVIKCNVDHQKPPFPNDFFDVVYSSSLFEHLSNPLFVLKEMKRVLKQNGRIVLLTDNAHSWNFVVGDAHSGGYEKRARGKGDQHYSLFNAWHLKNWFKKVGLIVEDVHYVEDDYISNGFIKKLLKKFINKILQITPFWKMGYKYVQIIGKKPKRRKNKSR
jgi:SAM-dependent methyltransferase